MAIHVNCRSPARPGDNQGLFWVSIFDCDPLRPTYRHLRSDSLKRAAEELAGLRAGRGRRTGSAEPGPGPAPRGADPRGDPESQGAWTEGFGGPGLVAKGYARPANCKV
jgi:hypothetical protein